MKKQEAKEIDFRGGFILVKKTRKGQVWPDTHLPIEGKCGYYVIRRDSTTYAPTHIKFFYSLSEPKWVLNSFYGLKLHEL